MCSISPVPPAVQGREEGDSTGPSVGAAPVSMRPLAIGTAAVAQLCALNLTREEALDWQISNRLFPLWDRDTDTPPGARLKNHVGHLQKRKETQC